MFPTSASAATIAEHIFIAGLLLMVHLSSFTLGDVAQQLNNPVPEDVAAHDEQLELDIRARMQNNPKMPPWRIGETPLRVFTGIYIESMSNFQAAQMSFDVDLYLYSNWKDPSLNHSGQSLVLVNDPRVRERIWLPDLYFANAKTSKFHEVTAPNFNLFIANDGRIASSTRITMNVACNLDLTRYPMDNQKCAIRMLSYAFVASRVNITWFSKQPTRYNHQIELPEFRIASLMGQYCDGTYSYAIMEDSERRDQFSCLEAVILLERQIGFHLVQSYIPTALIVGVSWLSFWIDRSAAPARVTLSFTALLTLSTLGNGMRFGLPQVSYAKAIDFWFGACMFFVFLNLAEYAAVNSMLVIALKYDRLAKNAAKSFGIQMQPTGRSFLMNNNNNNDEENNKFTKAERFSMQCPLIAFKKMKNVVEKGKEATTAMNTNGGTTTNDDEGGGELELEQWLRWQRLAKHYDRISMNIDGWSRLAFPTAFAAWNVFYWGYYVWYTAGSEHS